jgi:hypothetical protein
MIYSEYMKKFVVIFMAPAAVLAKWMDTPEAERKAAEEKMRGEWQTWMAAHKDAIVEIAGLGTTKRVSTGGVTDTKNDMMMYAVMQAESQDAVAAMLAGHVHLQIPEASIEIMAANPLG